MVGCLVRPELATELAFSSFALGHDHDLTCCSVGHPFAIVKVQRAVTSRRHERIHVGPKEIDRNIRLGIFISPRRGVARVSYLADGTKYIPLQ